LETDVTTLVVSVALAIISSEPTVCIKSEDGKFSSGAVWRTVEQHGRWQHQILTCAHGKEVNQRVTVRFNRAEVQGSVYAINHDYDLALVTAWRRQRFGSCDLLGRDDDVPAGEVLVSGYGTDTHHITYAERRTKTVGVRPIREWRHPLLEVEAVRRPGDSGGPLFVDGKLAGICVASTKVSRFDRNGLFVTHHEIHKFLEEAKLEP